VCMTYTVFARKYRPQGFDEVVGQDAIVTTLKETSSTCPAVPDIRFT
jgi:DNA polymerase III gamma/tau subunit